MNRPLKVALVGCGQIADAHLQQIRRIHSVELVAVCDLEPLLARQAAERFFVPAWYGSIDQMLSEAQPDVVHITTPVHTHAPIASQLLEAGVHVYVEKPFTVDLAEAEQLLTLARRQHRLVCLGHDQLFDPVWIKARALVDSGAIGDVQHIDSVLGYPINGPFGQLVLADPNHWVRRLPGGLFQNTMSHPLYRITELLPDSSPEVWAKWFSRQPDIPFPTELRVQLFGASVTGSLLFTSQTKPCYRMTRIYGTKAGIEVNLETQLIRFDRSARLPGVFGKIEAPVRQLRESVENTARGVRRFFGGGFRYFDGMKELFSQFYEAIQKGEESPVSYSEVLRVTGLMDRIFNECHQGEERNDSHSTTPSSDQSSIARDIARV
jgi:predicted dehydrogenase